MANELIDLIKTRRSVRSYKADPVPQELLDTVLEAGTYAPTGGGHQSPVIVAVTSPETRERLRALNAAVMGKETDPYYGAPAIMVVLADGGRGTFVEDGSCVLENLMLAAHAVGLSSCWIHREREIFDSEEGKALLKEWGLPEALRGVVVIPKSVHRDRMEQNIDVWDFELTADDMAQIAELTLDHSEIVNHDDPAFVKMLHGVSSVRTRL